MMKHYLECSEKSSASKLKLINCRKKSKKQKSKIFKLITLKNSFPNAIMVDFFHFNLMNYEQVEMPSEHLTSCTCLKYM